MTQGYPEDKAETARIERLKAEQDAREWQTKDSGKRELYASGMVRDTEQGKPRFDLLFPEDIPFEEQMLTRFAALMERGAQKYDARNWEQADSDVELARYKSSAARHFIQWLTGMVDEDHAAAVMFNLMAAETLKYKLGREELHGSSSNEGSTSEESSTGSEENSCHEGCYFTKPHLHVAYRYKE